MTITQMRGPLAMGLMMGLMLPFMVHEGAGLLFVLAHVAIVAVAGSVLLFVPRLRGIARTVLGHHRPRLSHIAPVGVGLTVGFGLVCAYCFSIGGAHWT